MRLILAVAAGLVAWPAGAQTVTDGSDKNVPADVVAVARSQMQDLLRDADGAKIRRLRHHARQVWCGEVNAATEGGGMTGYQPFLVNMETRRAWVANPATGDDTYSAVCSKD